LIGQAACSRRSTLDTQAKNVIPAAISTRQTDLRRLVPSALRVVVLTTQTSMPPKIFEIQRLKIVAVKASGGQGVGQPIKRINLA
jgi:hypothetical protein